MSKKTKIKVKVKLLLNELDINCGEIYGNSHTDPIEIEGSLSIDDFRRLTDDFYYVNVKHIDKEK
jgi:hypothetical protein